jgi:hypothetical protein
MGDAGCERFSGLGRGSAHGFLERVVNPRVADRSGNVRQGSRVCAALRDELAGGGADGAFPVGHLAAGELADAAGLFAVEVPEAPLELFGLFSLLAGDALELSLRAIEEPREAALDLAGDAGAWVLA